MKQQMIKMTPMRHLRLNGDQGKCIATIVVSVMQLAKVKDQKKKPMEVQMWQRSKEPKECTMDVSHNCCLVPKVRLDTTMCQSVHKTEVTRKSEKKKCSVCEAVSIQQQACV